MLSIAHLVSQYSPAASLQANTTVSPIEQHRQSVRDKAGVPLPRPMELDTTMYTSSPKRDFIDQVRQDLALRRRPMCALPEPVSAVHTPSYTRGSYQMAEAPGISVSVDLGPILWQHVSRGAPGNLGQILNETA